MWIKEIQSSIENVVANSVDKIGDSVTGFFKDLATDVSAALLDASVTVMKILIIYIIFRYMVGIDDEKQNKYLNNYVLLMGLYFVIRMLAEMARS